MTTFSGKAILQPIKLGMMRSKPLQLTVGSPTPFNRLPWVLILLLTIPLNVFGQSTWARTYGGLENDRANCIVETSEYGYLIAGTTASFGAGIDDMWVVKLDELGNMLWSRTYGGNLREEAQSVSETRP